MKTFRSLISLAFFSVAHGQSQQPTVKTDAGVVTGGICSNNPSAAYFKSIPFAQPPVGNLRFAPPVAFNGSYSNGKLNATAAAPACIQFGGAGGGVVEAPPYSEDCLYLDIWAPANATSNSGLPVRVWIYGGANLDGGISDTTYDGCNVPNTGAIMVSVNYRLGPLGWLALANNSDIAGNMGLQDQLLGLQWVQDNIGAFGGDPKKVVLQGQSAGAEDVFTIAALPQAPKLISAVIAESGGGRDTHLNDTAYFLGSNYVATLNCTTADTACIKSKSTAEIQAAFNNASLLNNIPLPALGVATPNSFLFGPFLDGKVVPSQASDVGVQVPAIFGSNSLEGTLFALPQFLSGSKIVVNASDYDLFLTTNFGSSLTPKIKEYYPISLFNSTPFPALYAISVVLADSTYFCPAYRGLNKAASNGIPVYAYLFDHYPTCSWYQSLPQEAVQIVGPAHTAELPFVFGDTHNLPLPNGTCNMTTAEMAISSFLNNAWTSMASIQRPTADPKDWPAYQGPNNTLGITILNSTIPGPINYTRCELWDNIDQFQEQLALQGTLLGTNATTVGTTSVSTAGTASTGIASQSSSDGNRIGSGCAYVMASILLIGACLL